MTDVIDVIILTWNDGDLLPEAIRSALSAADGLDLRITVVDNASDEPPQLVEDPRVHLVTNSVNRGVAGGRNDGMAATDAPLVCFLDSDAVLAPDSLVRLLEPIRSDPRIALAVPVFVDQAPEASAGRAPTLRVKLARMRNRRSDYESSPRDPGALWWDVDFGIGACQVFRREAFVSVGGLDESLWWADDADFCLRLRAEGWRVVQTSATRVLHPPRRRFNKPFSRKGLRHSWAVLRFLWRHRRSGSARGPSDAS